MTRLTFAELDLYDTVPEHLTTVNAGSRLSRSWSRSLSVCPTCGLIRVFAIYHIVFPKKTIKLIHTYSRQHLINSIHPPHTTSTHTQPYNVHTYIHSAQPTTIICTVGYINTISWRNQQILLGRKHIPGYQVPGRYYKTDELPNPRPIQLEKKKWLYVTFGPLWHLGHFFPQQIIFRGLGLILYRK